MRLFSTFSAPGYHTSIVSTFGVDFDAYEAIALPRLREAGCTNNVLVADARMLVQALSDGSHRPKFAGRRYSVVGAQATGVFHPKLVLQLGKTGGRLLVASANMTAAGMAGNLEVVGEVTVAHGSTQAAPLLRSALDYLLQFLAPASVPRRQVEWALKRARWLPASADAEPVVKVEGDERIAFLCRRAGKGLGERFIELVGARDVKRLVVVSPYWDMDLRALRALCQRLGAKKAAAVIRPQAALFPIHAHNDEGVLDLFDVSGVQGAGASRFAHAKVIIAESAAGDCVLFGSANCTEAALGTPNAPGDNEEASLFRDLPAGEAVHVLGLDNALAAGTEVQAADVPGFKPADEIPLAELAAKMPGRFELRGGLLRWWPAGVFKPNDAVVELYDQSGVLVPGELSRMGSLVDPASYWLKGQTTPHFAGARSGQFESSLAVVAVEQAIHEAQRRASGRAVESALELLDDDEAFEGLWLLEVIQRLAEAEREMRSPKGVDEEAPRQQQGAEPPSDHQILPYEEFIAGRRADDSVTATVGSHLGATHHESVRRFLNALIGKQRAEELTADDDEEAQTPDLGMGDETTDGAAAVESGDALNPLLDPATLARSSDAKKLRQRQRYVLDTQQSIVSAVGAFLQALRGRPEQEPLGVVDLLRLRALLAVVLGAGSKKTDLLPRDLATQVRRRQVLPSSGDASWRWLVGRLMFDFFRDHGGTSAPLIKRLGLEHDGAQGFPEDVMECWAGCFWAVCASRVAVNEHGMPFAVSASENLIARDLYRLTHLLPEQALGDAVGEVFAGMSRRYGERLGVDTTAAEQEHRSMIEALRQRPSETK
jgi:hypothetical protein